MMREQTSPRFRSQPGLLPGMLKRTKYSRLRNDSLTSLDDCPQRIKRELHLDSDFVQPDPGTSSDQGPSTLRDFIPRMANIRLHSPISLQSLRGQRTSAEDRTTDGPVSGSQWTPGPSQRPRSRGELLPHSALCRTQRPLTLHTITSLSWTPWTHTALSSETWTGTRAVHHDIKYMGSVEVTRSMRTLNFDARMQVTREAISKLCEKTSAKNSKNQEAGS
ncbi:hypothetical protein INR49_008809 [Caranx melampygus]|nr:hypothetical protein INR49_008809 [Caranx melampygus]